jgi:predicted nucleic acid-binding protein
VILVDTSVWIDHLRRGDEQLSALLTAGQVLAHPFITGELALGSLANRTVLINAMQSLEQATLATDQEVMLVIESRSLYGAGIGYVDAHLLASCLLTPGTQLWTRDKRLLSLAFKLDLAANNAH